LTIQEGPPLGFGGGYSTLFAPHIAFQVGAILF
jgi:hypothetical protein